MHNETLEKQQEKMHSEIGEFEAANGFAERVAEKRFLTFEIS